MPRLSARQYAQRIGVSGSYVSRLVREGKLPVDAEGRIDPDEADRILAATREPARAAMRTLPASASSKDRSTPAPAIRPAFPAPGMGSGINLPATSDLPTLLLRARTKTEVEKGKLLELKAKVEAGKFVDADEVKVAAFNKARIARDALINLASRLAPLVAARELACSQRQASKSLDKLSLAITHCDAEQRGRTALSQAKGGCRDRDLAPRHHRSGQVS